MTGYRNNRYKYLATSSTLIWDEVNIWSLLSQGRMNHSRIITLHDPTIDLYIFAATCRAKRQYFPTEHTSNPHLIPVELALDEHDFGMVQSAVQHKIEESSLIILGNY